MDGNWKATVDRLRAVDGNDGKMAFAAHVAGLLEADHPQAAVAAMLDLVFDDELPEGVKAAVVAARSARTMEPPKDPPRDDPPPPAQDSADSPPDVKVDDRVVVPGVIDFPEDEPVVPGDDGSEKP